MKVGVTSMRKLPPHVEPDRDRHGNPRLYFRVGKGKRTRLPLAVDTPEFAAAYHATYVEYQSGTSGSVRPTRAV
jgi:hypothetical protein